MGKQMVVEMMLDWRESNITPSQSKMTAEKQFTEVIVHLWEWGNHDPGTKLQRERQRDKDAKAQSRDQRR